MRPPHFVRTLSDEERTALEKGLRSADAFVLRRCQLRLIEQPRELPALGSAAFRQRLHSRVSRLWQTMRRYRLPSASLALLALALALTGRATLA